MKPVEGESKRVGFPFMYVLYFLPLSPSSDDLLKVRRVCPILLAFASDFAVLMPQSFFKYQAGLTR